MMSFAVTAIGKMESPLTQPESAPDSPTKARLQRGWCSNRKSSKGCKGSDRAMNWFLSPGSIALVGTCSQCIREVTAPESKRAYQHAILRPSESDRSA